MTAENSFIKQGDIFVDDASRKQVVIVSLCQLENNYSGSWESGVVFSFLAREGGGALHTRNIFVLEEGKFRGRYHHLAMERP